MTILKSTVDTGAEEFRAAREVMLTRWDEIAAEHAKALEGGGEAKLARHRSRGKLTARERIDSILDVGSPFLEVGALAGWGSDFHVGGSVIAGIGTVSGVECLLVANDPTIRGGTSNPWTLRKTLHCNHIAERNNLPVISLVESGGADLQTQKEVFIPGGQLFRDLTRLSKKGIPTIAVVYGNSTAGGGCARSWGPVTTAGTHCGRRPLRAGAARPPTRCCSIPTRLTAKGLPHSARRVVASSKPSIRQRIS